MFFVDGRFDLRNRFAPLLRCRLRRIDVALAQHIARQELGIAAEQNVGAAAGHVGGDRHGAFASGLRHDFGFLLVILGVQNDVFDAGALQHGS